MIRIRNHKIGGGFGIGRTAEGPFARAKAELSIHGQATYQEQRWVCGARLLPQEERELAQKKDRRLKIKEFACPF
jgi:hypothetical protein